MTEPQMMVVGICDWRKGEADAIHNTYAEAETLTAEIRRRWRLTPFAEALSDAVDAYLKARHTMTGPLDEKLIVAQVNLMNAQQAFEAATR